MLKHLTYIIFLYTITTFCQNWQPYFHPPQDLPVAKPNLFEPFEMAGHSAMRLTDFDTIKKQLYGFNISGINIHHSYPRHQVFSKDNNYILGNSGWKWRALWKADGTFVRQINEAGANGSTRWSNTENDYIYIVDTDIKSFCKVNVLTDEKEVLRKFPYEIGLGKSEGDLSNDGTKVVFTSNDNGNVRLTMYNIVKDTFNEVTIPRSYDAMNWGSVSYSGNYVLVAFDDEGKDLLLYDWEGNYIRRIGRHGHGDIGYDENGDECWFAIGVYKDVYEYSIVGKWRLSDNKTTILLGGNNMFTNGYTTGGQSMSGHISARATDVRPGVIHISLNDAQGPYHFFALKTDGSQEIELWGWDNSTSTGWSPQLTPDRTGKNGVWKSDWGDTNNKKEMYLVTTCIKTGKQEYVTAHKKYTWLINNQTYTESGVYKHESRDKDGCIIKSELILTIEQTSVEEDINPKIYPNPTSNFITIALKNENTPFKVELYNSLGQIVKSVTQKTIITVSDLQKGVYFLRVYNDYFDKRSKIAVE